MYKEKMYKRLVAFITPHRTFNIVADSPGRHTPHARDRARVLAVTRTNTTHDHARPRSTHNHAPPPATRYPSRTTHHDSPYVSSVESVRARSLVLLQHRANTSGWRRDQRGKSLVARRSLVLGLGRLALPAHRKRHAARVLLGLLLDLVDRLTYLMGSKCEGGDGGGGQRRGRPGGEGDS